MNATNEPAVRSSSARAPRLLPPIAHRVPRGLALVLGALVPLTMLIVPVWMIADGATRDTWGAALASVLFAASAVLAGAGAAWLVDRVDGPRSTDAKRRRSVLVGASVTALLTLIGSAFAGSAIAAATISASDGVGNVFFGTLLGGGMAIWIAPLLAIPAAAFGTVLVARSAGVRDTGLLVLLTWIGGVSLVGATADPLAARAWAIAVIVASAIVLLGAAFANLHRLFWAIRLVCTPHRFWRLEVTEAHPDALPDLPRLASTERSVVLMLRDDSAGGPFRGADSFHPVAVLPSSAATWVISTLARTTVALSLASVTIALSLTSL